jgi:glycosyltransferase involved in cell wall biosynthesis
VPVVAIPSRFQFNKSPAHVVRALEEVRRRVRFRVVVFGRGAEYYSLPPWVENAGTVSEEVKVMLIKSSDLVLQVGFPEPFGLVPLEAVALGVPALVSRASGAAEVFPEEATYTPEDLPEKLVQLLGDRSVREGLWFRERESPIMRRSWRDVWAEVREAVGVG